MKAFTRIGNNFFPRDIYVSRYFRALCIKNYYNLCTFISSTI